MNPTFLFWLIPVFITIHNFEELLLMPTLLNTDQSYLPAFVDSLLGPVIYSQFAIAVGIVTVLPYLFIGFYQKFPAKKHIAVYLLIGIQTVMFINVFSHVGAAVLLGRYTPGIITALTINLPFSVYLFWQSVQQGWISRRAQGVLLLVGVILHGPGLLALMYVSGLLVNNL